MKRLMGQMVCALLASVVCADQLVVTGQTKEGSFERYENGRFVLNGAKGKNIRELAGRVTRLVLDAPLKVSYLTTDSKQAATAELKGYDKKAFMLVQAGKEILIPQMKMKTIEPVFEGAEGGGVEKEGSKYPIPQVDLKGVEGTEMTPAQKGALDRFKAEKRKFDDFVAENGAMVQAMDKATGAKREELLNKLRMRKNEEQPLRQALVGAYDALVDAFPASAAEKPAPAP